MSDDYSTPTSPESASAGWVKGNLPQEQEKEKEREPVQKPGFSVPSQNGALTLGAFVESLLFVADGPVPVARLAEALEVTPREVEAALTTLGEAYATAHRGLSLQRFRDKVQLTTAPAAASAVERFLGLAATAPLSRAPLATPALPPSPQPRPPPHADT